MPAIDWSIFESKNPNQRDSFEELCLHLFTRRLKLDQGATADYNQAGLETMPVEVDGKYYGFQSKHFDRDTDYKQIKDSVETALTKYGTELDEICIYLNTNSKPHSSPTASEIVKSAAKKKVKIVWFTRSNFETVLTKPENIDLAQFYFGYGTEIGFIKGNVNLKSVSLINSKSFIKLSYVDSSNKIVKNLERKVKQSSNQIS